MKKTVFGFTLVELLVVMAIISILAAMLLPTLEQGLTQARILVCMNQQKQIALGMGMYLGDSQGRIPPSYNYRADGTFLIERNQPSHRWYQAYPAKDVPLRIGYVYQNYLNNGHVMYCPDLEASVSPYTYAHTNGWNRVDESTTVTRWVWGNYLSLGIDDRVTRELASTPSDFGNYFNLFSSFLLKPHVERNLRLPMTWDMGHFYNSGASWIMAHRWQGCNVAYWDGSAVTIPGVEAFVRMEYATGHISINGLMSTKGVQFVSRK